MIPQKLELTNFLSYRETAELNFNGIDLACISGANGAGKSSILDAITWSLFGRSRSRSDDDLVNRLAAISGEAAEVRFTFILEGATYRVIRRKGARKATVLELQIATGDDSWKTLSERKLRETEAQIEHLLHMNYDTFTNASFLLQGKADQFTTHTANKRKEILAELLGVTEWERYREAAADTRKAEEGNFMLLEARLADILEELAEKPERESALERAKAARAGILETLTLQEKLLNQMRQTAAAVDQQKILVKNLAGSVERIKRNLASSAQTLEKRRREKESSTQILAETAEIMAGYAAWQSAESLLQSWQEKANSHNVLLRQKQPFEIIVAETRSRLQQEQQQLEAEALKVQKAKSDRPALQKAIKNGSARLVEIETELAELADLQTSLMDAQAKLQQLEGQRALEQQELTRLETQERRMQKVAAEKTAVLNNKEQAADFLASIEAQIVDVSEQQNRFIESKAELDTLVDRQQPLREEMETLKERIDRLEAAELDSECPTCGQPLSAEHRSAVLSDLHKEGKKAGDDFRANGARINKLEQQGQQLQGAFQQKERLERDQKTQQQRLAQAEARLSEIEQIELEWHREGETRLAAQRMQLADDSAIKAQADLVAGYQTQLKPQASLQHEQKKLQEEMSTARAAAREMEQRISEWDSSGQKQLDVVREKLTKQAFALDARDGLADLQKKIEAVGYDSATHEQALAERDTLANAPTRHQELKQAEAIVGQLDDTISELVERISEQEQNLSEQSQQLATAESRLQALIAGSADLESTQDAVFRLREDEIAAAQAVGAAQQRLDVLQDLQTQKAQLAQEKTTLSLRIQQLKLLEKSCGRQGVQALLIEHALPEIEERANNLLERLTGGDMRIYFETQRKLKTRDALAETLDIRIADKDGERPYSNYSGGEQFRINFAIRLALSQLLARRAGARLQTLVVDEGFGSQDPEGRQRLVEAINAVRDEFACILVITHIAALRDAFSTRIEIQKTLSGSAIRVT
jgi:exonuclease SbcC